MKQVLKTSLKKKELAKRIVIFASGSGSNAENIIQYFLDKKNINVVHVVTNNKNAKVINRCKRLKINYLIINKRDLRTSKTFLNFLKKETDYIVLAGFLLKIPENIITDFPNKIVNIHPALLPKYGGKGMYGKHIHDAVIKNKEKETGITIHFVNENYDEGAIIFQKKTKISKSDNANDVAKKISKLEMANFPKVIEALILKHNKDE